MFKINVVHCPSKIFIFPPTLHRLVFTFLSGRLVAAGLYCSGMGKITRGRGGQRYKGLVIRLLVVFTLVQSLWSCSVETAVYGYSHWNFTITDTASLLLPTKYKCKWSILLSQVWQDRNPDWLSSCHQLQQNWWIRNISLLSSPGWLQIWARERGAVKISESFMISHREVQPASSSVQVVSFKLYPVFYFHQI